MKKELVQQRKKNSGTIQLFRDNGFEIKDTICVVTVGDNQERNVKEILQAVNNYEPMKEAIKQLLYAFANTDDKLTTTGKNALTSANNLLKSIAE